MTEPSTPNTNAAMFEHLGQSTCRLADGRMSLRPSSTGWAISRASEADRPAIEQFRSQGVVIADDYDVAAATCTDLLSDMSEEIDCRSWIARADDNIVGLLSISVYRSQMARLSVLCVEPRYRDSRLPADLLGNALDFCWNAGVLKIVLSTHLPLEEAWAVFGECGYEVARHGRRHGRNVMEFYLDLYKLPDCERSKTDVCKPQRE